jgi:hypothetical protein
MKRSIIACSAALILTACASYPAPKGDWTDFATLEPGLPSNRYLLCAPAICEVSGNPDETLRFSHSAGKVAAELVRLQPDAEQRILPNGDIQLRYVAVTPVARFRDDVDVLVRPSGPEAAEVAIYSRSRIGLSDLGKNKSRVDALVKQLEADLAR